MSNLDNLLDNYRVSCSLKSDSALATSLGITRQSVFQWRSGVASPKDDHVILMAKAIGEPAERWLAAISLDRASPEAKKYWMKLLQAAAAIAGAFLLVRHGVDADSTAAFLLSPSIHYAKLWRRAGSASVVLSGPGTGRGPRPRRRAWYISPEVFAS